MVWIYRDVARLGDHQERQVQGGRYDIAIGVFNGRADELLEVDIPRRVQDEAVALARDSCVIRGKLGVDGTVELNCADPGIDRGRPCQDNATLKLDPVTAKDNSIHIDRARAVADHEGCRGSQGREQALSDREEISRR